MAVPHFVPSPRGPFLFITHMPHGYSSRQSFCWQAELYASVRPKNLNGISVLPSVQGSRQTEVFTYIPSVEFSTRILAKLRSFQGPSSRLDGLIMGMYPEETV